MSSNYSNLHKAATQNFLLDGNKFANLKSLIGFSEYRVYCTKPYHGRTNHAKFSYTNPSSVPLFNYTTEASYYPPSSLCNALVYMSDDSSKTNTLPCHLLRPYPNTLNDRLYVYIWYVNSQAFLSVINNFNMLCDDYVYDSGYDNYGTWMFYVK